MLTVRTDTELFDYLEKLIKNCPSAQITFNDDPDVESEYGMEPLGYTIRTDGCRGTDSVTADTLREAVNEAMCEDS
ncbi:MAG: hypothetical protein H0X34_20430 [Chthoniobacterales bacterium]|nr:hypothetical protein [Chthoniobacterales bacterium]